MLKKLACMEQGCCMISQIIKIHHQPLLLDEDPHHYWGCLKLGLSDVHLCFPLLPLLAREINLRTNAAGGGECLSCMQKLGSHLAPLKFLEQRREQSALLSQNELAQKQFQPPPIPCPHCLSDITTDHSSGITRRICCLLWNLKEWVAASLMMPSKLAQLNIQLFLCYFIYSLAFRQWILVGACRAFHFQFFFFRKAILWRRSGWQSDWQKVTHWACLFSRDHSPNFSRSNSNITTSALLRDRVCIPRTHFSYFSQTIFLLLAFHVWPRLDHLYLTFFWR